MDMLHIFLLALWGVVSCSDDSISGSGSVSVVSVRPGDNIALYCDCRLSNGVYIVWYRNCSHENQPALALKSRRYTHTSQNDYLLKSFPRFELLRNYTSESYDLLITNVTDSDEGLYYCGTETTKVEDEKFITLRNIYRYGNVTTRIIVNPSTHIIDSVRDERGLCWMVMFAPAITVLSTCISFILVYHFWQKAAPEPQVFQKSPPDITGKTSWHQDEDLCLTRVVFRVQDGQMHQ